MRPIVNNGKDDVGNGDCNDEDDNKYDGDKVRSQTKKRYYLGIFPKRRPPPPPSLLGTPYPKKYEICNMKYEI